MRKQTAFVLAVLLVFGMVAAYADEAVLIDFSSLGIDYDKDGDGNNDENAATTMNFAKPSDPDDMKKLKITSLAVGNWEVELASSSSTIINNALSMTKAVTLPDSSKYFPGKLVLGIRVHFPVEPFNSWAKIKPPFEIPAYQAYGKDEKVPDGAVGSKFEGAVKEYGSTKMQVAYGVVKNVGVLKYLAVTVRGLNYPHGLSVILEDSDGNEQIIFLGYLNFEGWKELKWENPQYIGDIRKRELKIYPLYPKATPFVKFKGFLITRDGANIGGDFICYIKDVKIMYEKAVLNTEDLEFDESQWNIIGTKEAELQKIEADRFGELQILRFIEEQKLEQASEFSDSVK